MLYIVHYTVEKDSGVISHKLEYRIIMGTGIGQFLYVSLNTIDPTATVGVAKCNWK